MKKTLNTAFLVGYICHDPQINETENKKKVASLSIATSDSWKDKTTNEYVERTDYHKIVVFSPTLVSLIEQEAKKGTKLYVNGTIKNTKWTDKNGIERATTEIVVSGPSSSIAILKNNQFVEASYEILELENMQIDQVIPV